LFVAWLAYRTSPYFRPSGDVSLSDSSSCADLKQHLPSKAEQEASVLFVQQMFRFSTDQEAVELLKKLKSHDNPESAWIEVSTPAFGVRGNAYRLGPAALASLKEWQDLGRCLFGDKGLMAKYLFNPVLFRPPHGQGPHGCLVLSIVDNFGPMTVKEVVHCAKGFMVSKTAESWLGRLRNAELILKHGDEYFTPENLYNRILEDEELSEASDRAKKFDQLIGEKQEKFQTHLLGGPTMARTRSFLKKEPCFYCRTRPRKHGGETEHFPPKHWGGSDKHSLLLPICRGCNGSHGPKIARLEKANEPEITIKSIVFPGSAADAEEWFFSFMVAKAVRYADLLNEDRVEEAFEEATSFFPTWMALRQGVDVIDSNTGVVTRIAIKNELAAVENVAKTLGYIPRLLKASMCLSSETA
jgi:hypothetical protein